MLGPELGLNPEELPGIVVVQPDETGGSNASYVKRFKMEGPMGEKEIIKFATDVKEGNVEPHYKSADVPTGDQAFSEGLWMVVGKNFNSVVRDPTKDVLLNIADYQN